MNIKPDKPLQWKWVGISLGMYLVFYFLPLFLLFNSDPNFKSAFQVILGLWMFMGLFIISGIIGFLSKDITIKEPTLTALGLIFIWILGVQIKFKDSQHFTVKNYMNLLIVLLIVGILSLAGAWWGELIQKAGKKKVDG